MLREKIAVYTLILSILILPSKEQLSQKDKDTLLRMHNEARDKIRSCKLPGQPPVKGTYLPMVWDDEIAEFAQKWSENCVLEHGGKPPGTGQNLAGVWSIDGAPYAWFNEHAYYTHKNHSCAPNRACGHYTQMVWQESTRLGCGATYCHGKNPDWKYGYFIVCNYRAAGNLRGRRPYVAGSRSDCVSAGWSLWNKGGPAAVTYIFFLVSLSIIKHLISFC
ncbi:hypothetical protein CRM22_009571 [Opisthorchis felineus]|uniref:SCP domain-containing protein n=1 Tax=Opisthorchis felineus TaxID=147828 RepID=A0A4S2L698_OPIFE|nr:hypothetical protein CRM22_009571 [Opisthorchis felineus]TGZ58571.1 hypothetical protein CRM22_009571 [Opisthorchis felineus]TGZ58572.1 hypothetical protein CRM22_009571 [Opisthorchis felineus]